MRGSLLVAGLVLASATACGSGGDAVPVATVTSSCEAPGASAAASSGDVLEAAKSLLSTLDDDQRGAVRAERTPANLAHWSDLPDARFPRAGLRMGALGSVQRAAVLGVLRAALSDRGYQQVIDITAADGIDRYWVRILGAPTAAGIWTLQFGGHNLALNLTVEGDALTLAPTLRGGAGPLCGEIRKGQAFIDDLDPGQQQASVLPQPVHDVVLGPGQDGRTLPAAGIAASTLRPQQQALLLALVDQWLSVLDPAQAAVKQAAFRKGLAETTFARYGSTYYRVQGPTVFIELAQQPDTGEVHAVYREPGNDYGAAAG
ncbi:DUF3500 domain-containing protein [Dactylosporangium sp. NPDC049140]|uniref:DUF3500 domain-containing protein n=1 Tax=Dactylosporangium sp. NPDC049140 TaxID=3155647 RepID=UPI0033D4259B